MMKDYHLEELKYLGKGLATENGTDFCHCSSFRMKLKASTMTWISKSYSIRYGCGYSVPLVNIPLMTKLAFVGMFTYTFGGTVDFDP